MTYETDPVRWTSSPEGAPPALRDPLRAAASEGPSAAQMRMLSLKLAAIATTGAMATATSTAHASSTAAGGAAASVSTVKLAIAAVALGAAALGATVMLTSTPTPTQPPSQAAASVGGPASTAHQDAPTLQALPSDPSRTAESAAAEPAQEPGAEQAPTVESLQAPTTGAEVELETEDRAGAPDRPLVKRARGATGAAATDGARARARPTARPSGPAPVKAATVHPSEVELLSRARAALAASPRDAFALTEAHREYYPRGVFAQERDALAIEALMRAGDLSAARRLARRFIAAHPSSPHAHRFREAMGLH